jgi:hypothetical protein
MDGGRTWKALSGDLTRHAPETMEKSGGPITGDMNGPEVYGVIFAVGPSKLDANVIWTGSDDGLVHVTRNGGVTWTNVTPKDMPDFGRVSQIDASKFDAGIAYIAVKRPLLNDRAPYIFKTADYGRTWTKIVNGIRADAYVHAVREDPYRKGLLYAATQHGVSISYDDGAGWQNLNMGLPDVPVADLQVEANELVIASHGRGFWALDNITPLRQASEKVMAADMHLYTPPPAVRGGSPANIQFTFKTAPRVVKLDVLDSAGAVLRTFESDTAPAGGAAGAGAAGGGAGGRGGRGGGGASVTRNVGMNRLTWDLRTPPVVTFPGMILWGGGGNGPAVPPGKYTLRLAADGKTVTAPLVVKRNPLLPEVTDADLHAQYEFGRKARDRATDANNAVIAIRRVKTQLDDRLKKAAADEALKSKGDVLRTNASGVEEKVYQVRNQSGQDPLNFPIKVNNRLMTLLSMSQDGDGPPNASYPEIFTMLSTELRGYQTELDVVWKRDLAAVNKELARLKLPAIDPTCAKAEGCVITP